MKLRYQNLKVCVRYMDKYIEETIPSDATVSRVSIRQSSKLPQMILAVKKEDCVVMQLNNNTVQVNFLVARWRLRTFHDVDVEEATVFLAAANPGGLRGREGL